MRFGLVAYMPRRIFYTQKYNEKAPSSTIIVPVGIRCLM